MKMYDWLEKNNYTIESFSKQIGCHRGTIRKANFKIPIFQSIALKIRIATADKVRPVSTERGRPINISTDKDKKNISKRKIENKELNHD